MRLGVMDPAFVALTGIEVNAGGSVFGMPGRQFPAPGEPGVAERSRKGEQQLIGSGRLGEAAVVVSRLMDGDEMYLIKRSRRFLVLVSPEGGRYWIDGPEEDDVIIVGIEGEENIPEATDLRGDA